MQITILGCGGSWGVPKEGLDWGACDATDPLNRRTRSSILVESDTTRILVDCGGHYLQQAQHIGNKQLSALLLTHGHRDHTGGIFDLHATLPLQFRLDVYADLPTFGVIQRRVTQQHLNRTEQREINRIYDAEARLLCQGATEWNKQTFLDDQVVTQLATGSRFNPHIVEVENGPFYVGDIKVTPFHQPHRDIHSLGFLFETREGIRFAYSTDTNYFYQKYLELLKDVDLWVVDCGKSYPNDSHSHPEQTLEWIRQVQPARALLTHMNQTIDYEALSGQLPPHVKPAHDGLTIDLANNSDQLNWPANPSRPTANPHTSGNKAAAAGN